MDKECSRSKLAWVVADRSAWQQIMWHMTVDHNKLIISFEVDVSISINMLCNTTMVDVLQCKLVKKSKSYCYLFYFLIIFSHKNNLKFNISYLEGPFGFRPSCHTLFTESFPTILKIYRRPSKFGSYKYDKQNKLLSLI